MQKENADTKEFKDSLQSAIEHLKSMTPGEHANWAKLIYFIMAFLYERRERSEHNDFLDVIKTNIEDKSRRKEVEEMGKTMAQELIEEGEARGKAMGEEKGKAMGRELGTIEAKQDAIIRLIRIRFEYIPETLANNIKSINQIDKLNTIFERAVIAKTLNDLEIMK